jgi:phosphatidylserine/phosphatidylglycerophosphate/cardiolipin synthase-like enzyme
MYLADIGQTDNRCKNAPPRDKIDAWADLAASPQSLGQQSQLDPAKKALLGEFNNKLKLATLYYSDNAKQWKVGSTWKNAGNHSKIYIIDEDCFYVGSDNFYASMHKEGLQEFGYLVEDKNETRKFIAAYWDNLWKYSGKMALS